MDLQDVRASALPAELADAPASIRAVEVTATEDSIRVRVPWGCPIEQFYAFERETAWLRARGFTHQRKTGAWILHRGAVAIAA